MGEQLQAIKTGLLVAVYLENYEMPPSSSA